MLAGSWLTLRRALVFVLGAAVLLLGLAMIFLPGPAIVVVPAGLVILGLEFAWARRWLRALRARLADARDRWTSSARVTVASPRRAAGGPERWTPMR
jgi:hypothetical protein